MNQPRNKLSSLLYYFVLMLFIIILVTIEIFSRVSENLQNISIIHDISLKNVDARLISIDNYCQTAWNNGDQSKISNRNPYLDGHYYLQNGDWVLAISSFKASSRMPLSNFFIGISNLCNGDLEKAYQMWRENSKEVADFFTRNGESLYQIGDFTNAEIWFQNALNVNEKSRLAFQRLGQIEESRKEIKNALEYYRKAIQADPNFSEPYFLAASIEYKNGDFGQALIDIRNALNLSPTIWYYRHIYGEILFNRGDLDSAKEEFQAAIQYNPNSCWSHLGLVEIYLRTKDVELAYNEFVLAQSSCEDANALSYYHSLLTQQLNHDLH